MNLLKFTNPLVRTTLITLLVSGVIPMLAILSDYSGEVTIKLGTDGIQLQITGDRSKIC
jgi:hypothetical protein